jgi:hypothetical protein
VDWKELAAAYHAHHFNCPTCIAAGRGSRYGQRCGAGMALWRAVNLTQFNINVANFEPQSKRVTRPDTSLRMKGAHAALSHSDWLEKKVTAARAGLADGTNTRIAPQEWQSVRAAKQKQRDAQ